jgi:hypothetical protein
VARPRAKTALKAAVKKQKPPPASPAVRINGPTTLLILGDPHAKPGDSFEHVDWAGRLIVDTRPSLVLMGGDLFEMGSMSSFENGKVGQVTHSFRADIIAGQTFDDRLWAPWKKVRQRYDPRRVAIEGNHEYRLTRYLNQIENAKMAEMVSFDTFGFDRHWTEVIRYQGLLPGVAEILPGLLTAHHFSNKMGKALGATHHGHQLLQKNYMSSLAFHSHLIDVKTAVRPGSEGARLWGIVGGCYINEQNGPFSYSGDEKAWWRGVILGEVDNGDFTSLRLIDMKQLRNTYGKQG